MDHFIDGPDSLVKMATIYTSQAILKSFVFNEDLYSNTSNAVWDRKMKELVHDKLPILGLPKPIEQDLEVYLYEMGTKLFSLFKHISEKCEIFGQEVKLPKTLFWDSNLTFDVRKMITQWLCDTTSGEESLFAMGLEYGMDRKWMKKLWRAIVNKYGQTEDKSARLKNFKSLVTTEFTYPSALFYLEHGSEDEKQTVKDNGIELDEVLLDILVNEGRYELVKCLWQNLDEEVIRALIEPCFLNACQNSVSGSKYDYGSENFKQLAIFFYEKMDVIQKNNILRSNHNHIASVLFPFLSWPWIKLTFPILHRFWSEFEKEDSTDKKITDEIIFAIFAAVKKEKVTKNSKKMLELLGQIWLIVPEEFQEQIKKYQARVK